jgi:hypothetical protein
MTKRKIKHSSSGYEHPDFELIRQTNPSFRKLFHQAMLFAHYECSHDALKKETIKYIKANYKTRDTSLLSNVDDIKFHTIGKISYIINKGAHVPEDISCKIDSMVESLFSHSNTDDVEEAINTSLAKTRPTIQDRIADKVKSVAGEIEGWVDDFVTSSRGNDDVKSSQDFMTLFNSNGIKAIHAKRLKDTFTRIHAELGAIVNDDDTEAREYYSHLSKMELKRFYKFYANLFEAIDNFVHVEKVTRAPRKKKPIDIEKIVAKFKYLQEDITLSLVSLHPRNIHGAKEVWVYNSKTCKLGCYRAQDEGGLVVKGTSISNFSIDSVEKRLRKPVDILAELKKCGKVKLRTFLADIKAVDIKLKGRTNEFTIILRVEK